MIVDSEGVPLLPDKRMLESYFPNKHPPTRVTSLMALVELDDISVLHPSSLPEACSEASSERPATTMPLGPHRGNGQHSAHQMLPTPQSGLKRVAITAEQDLDNPVATCKVGV
jgi:hypothetical protein